MSKRYLVLGLSAVLALAVAVPAIGQSSDPTATTSASAKKTAKKALKKAKQAKKLAQQALNENDAQDTSITNIEQQLAGGGGGGGGAGAQGPPGPQGPAGPAGPAGSAGASFNDNADGGDVTVTSAGFSLIFEDNCDVFIDSTFDGFWLLDFGGGVNPIDNTDARALVESGSEQHLVTAYQDDGSGVAQFEFVTNDVGATCDVAGTVIGSSTA
jgi:hypothetical protein